MHILHVVGARPNFIKAAPVMAALRGRCIGPQTLVHTGQHYDAAMSEVFFEQLNLPQPDVHLGVGSGSHAEQTARVMTAIEPVLLSKWPDLLMVYGDVNSTVAAALVAAKLGIPIAHVEAGLRSFDRSMPEEINRLVTDRLSGTLLTPSAGADRNLLAEGAPPRSIHRVGNVMIDTLVRLLPRAELPDMRKIDGEFALVTLHRPANVDEPYVLRKWLAALCEISRACRLIFPVHPRTRRRLSRIGFDPPAGSQIELAEPLGYLQMLALQRRARAVITDSGGVQEETTWLGVPCLTLRENTERPVTVEIGTNTLVGRDPGRLKSEMAAILSGRAKQGAIPPLWDGRAAQRIADLLVRGLIVPPRVSGVAA